MNTQTKMTPQEMRIAIAEACGWVPLPMGEIWRDKDGYFARADGKPGHFNVPDYPADLNAMHEAEKTLTPDQQIDYLAQLFDLAFAGDQNPDTFMGQVCATALQRAEAFCRVKYPERFVS